VYHELSQREVIMTEQNHYIPPIVFHPGEMLKEKLEELGMGPKEFAIRAEKPEKTISAILKGESSITPEMAIQFERVLKIPANFWIRRQYSFDEFKAREKAKETINNAIPWAQLFPLAEMKKMKWIDYTSNKVDKASALLSFFSLSSHLAWENYYMRQPLKVCFRMSLAHSKEPYAISAWLRKGEITASGLAAKPYSEKIFKNALIEVKKIMMDQPEEFFSRLQMICLNAGVKVVHTPCLPKAPINGAARWLNDNPLIQLTGRHKRNDIFWFSFFHEAGHILLHGKKDVFVDEGDGSNLNDIKEKQADDFAIDRVFSKAQETEVISQNHLSENDILRYAKKFETHPGIIIGRLQHSRRIPHSVGREFICKIEL
jgi:HTH-type transcriptional regulator / antitoxin HigA